MINKCTIISIIFAYFLPLIGNTQCHYTIDMQDSFGDGWNGASVDVNVNGIPSASFGFANGNSSTDSLFTLNGDIVEFNFVSETGIQKLHFRSMIQVECRF